METCKIPQKAGFSECLQFEAPVKNIFLILPGQMFTKAERLFDTNPEDLIEDLTYENFLYMPHSLIGYENTTEDVKVFTSPYGRTYQTRTALPSFKFTVADHYANFQAIRKNLHKRRVGVVFVLEDGSVKVWDDGSGNLYGFTASVYVPIKGAVTYDNPEAGIELYIEMLNPEELKTQTVIKPTIDIIQETYLKRPVPIRIYQSGNYVESTGKFKVKVQYISETDSHAWPTIDPAAFRGDVILSTVTSLGNNEFEIETVPDQKPRKLWYAETYDGGGAAKAVVSNFINVKY